MEHAKPSDEFNQGYRDGKAEALRGEKRSPMLARTRTYRDGYWKGWHEGNFINKS